MKIKTLTLLAMTALLAASCIKDEPKCSTCDENPDGRGILLSFNDGTDTRSTLQSSEVDYKDVKDVYLYVFEGTGSEAECILSEDVDWKGDISQQHWISTDLNAGIYTFLAVGVDDKAGEVYGLTDKYNGTLGECLAKLAQGKGKSDMARAQIFAGQTTQTVAVEDDVVEVGVTLTRKVAGVLAYLRNIPVSPEKGGASSVKVKSLRLSLCSNQNTQMPMWTEEGKENYGSEPLNNSNVLFDIDLAAAGYTEGELYFEKPGIDENGLQTLDNTLLLGAYLLPLKNETQESTLKLELIGNYTDMEGEHKDVPVKTYTITHTDETEEGEQTTSGIFNIEENKLYCIGKKLSDGSTDGDKPADLSGNIIVVNVRKWCDVQMDNTFPTVQGPARFETEYNPENYIFDAPGTSFQIRILPPSPLGRWDLTVTYESGDGFSETAEHKDWIHFRIKDADGNYLNKEYEETVFDTGGYGQVVEVTLNDFAEPREYTGEEDSYDYIKDPNTVTKIKEDFRTAYLTLKTTGTTEPVTYKVRQYNTITVNRDRGVARLDYGCSFNLETGEAIRPSEEGKDLIQWGEQYWWDFPVSITGTAGDMDYYDGEDSAVKALEYDAGLFAGSAMDLLYVPVIDIPNTSNLHWYLPAYFEMWNMAVHMNPYRNLAEECADMFNMQKGDKYWCANALTAGDTTYDGDIHDAYIVEISSTSSKDVAQKNAYLRARPIRKFETE